METEVRLVERPHARHVERVLLVGRDSRLRREQGRPQEHAVQVVRPGVVRALEEALDRSVGRLAELRPPMPAEIVMRAKLAGAVPADDQRAPGNVDDHEAPGVGDLVRHAHGDPRAAEDPLELERVELGRRVCVRDQRRRAVDGQPGGAVGLLSRKFRGGHRAGRVTLEIGHGFTFLSLHCGGGPGKLTPY